MDDVVEPAAGEMLLPRVLAALADPHRLATVRFLARHGESWCAQVRQEAGLELSKSTFSHHLRIMREAGLVTKRIQGARGYAQLRKEDVDRRFPGLLDSVLNADDPALVLPYSPNVSSRSLNSRVVAAAAEALARQGFVTPVDVCLGLGWLHASNVDDWRHGRVDDLVDFLPVRGDKITELIVCLDSWARERSLERTEAEYISATPNRRPLRFFSGAPAAVEAVWRTRWVSRDLPAQKRERITRAQDSPPDLVVVQPVRDWTCAECKGTGDLLIMDDAGPLCLACADLDHLVFLPSGEAALTRRAKKASGLSAVVVRWSRTRKRYERQGLLVEDAALEQAEQQCLADSDARMRRRERDRERRASADVELQAAMTGEIKRLFPRCPASRAEAIAQHMSLRGSGRVGRSAAGRSLDEEALTLAVAASVRHEDTDYDSLLMSGVSRAEARDLIRPAVDRLLASWS